MKRFSMLEKRANEIVEWRSFRKKNAELVWVMVERAAKGSDRVEPTRHRV